MPDAQGTIADYESLSGTRTAAKEDAVASFSEIPRS